MVVRVAEVADVVLIVIAVCRRGIVPDEGGGGDIRGGGHGGDRSRSLEKGRQKNVNVFSNKKTCRKLKTKESFWRKKRIANGTREQPTGGPPQVTLLL